jgi:3-dehydroquinate dehydratase II
MSRRYERRGSGRIVRVLHGPNLGVLGRRDPSQYGTDTLDQIMDRLYRLASDLEVAVEGLQSDHEGELVSSILAARAEGVSALVMNPGAFAHTSYALRDATAAAGIPLVEVHLSNVHARERWRQHLAIAPAARGVIAGLGPASYELGLRAAAELAAAPAAAERPASG